MGKLLFLIFIILCLTSCFEVLEQFSFNSDGSGNMKLIVNMSQSKTKLKSIMLMETVNGHKVPSEDQITSQLEEIVLTASKASGISNVKKETDFINFIFSFSCDFKSTVDLNKMIQSIRKDKQKKTIDFEDHVSFDKANKSISRNFNFDWSKDYLKLSDEDKDVLQKATFTGIYKLTNEVVSNSNAQAKIAANKKAVMLKLNLKDIINKTQTIKNTIQYN